ncbi:MAG: ATP-binding protein [Defluviicoccus sp.]|nr:ATP-binding protein [Defluviicoccus sp.]MDE0274367.1 ATP-binding protein [Defluviicoccus sp.]
MPPRRDSEEGTLNIAILELSLRNDLAELAVAAAQVDRFCATHGLSPDIAFAVNLSVDELLTNTIRYGYPNGGSHRIAMTVRLDGGVLQVELEDEAEPYDPTTVPHPDIGAPIEARPIGGLGVHFVREMMDGFAYRRGEDRNIVTLTKHTQSGGIAS